MKLKASKPDKTNGFTSENATRHLQEQDDEHQENEDEQEHEDVHAH